jgi:esterase/lipase superfamily enzyme
MWTNSLPKNPEKHVELLDVQTQGADTFFTSMATRQQSSKSKSVLIYIHGYRVTFADAARRTAQIAYDLGFDGAPVFYSWPSMGTTLGYPTDEESIMWTEPHLKAFLRDIATRTGSETVHLIAHSMGNRALTNVFRNLTQSGELPRGNIFRNLILTAPDISADIFRRDIVPALVASGARITLYSSTNDRALQASKWFHTFPRAGDAGDGLVVSQGLDTVDASEVDTSFLGHLTFDSRSVLDDIYYLIQHNLPPDQRAGLFPAGEGDRRYWAFQSIGNH